MKLDDTSTKKETQEIINNPEDNTGAYNQYKYQDNYEE
jgi:hypothetical protein